MNSSQNRLPFERRQIEDGFDQVIPETNRHAIKKQNVNVPISVHFSVFDPKAAPSEKRSCFSLGKGRLKRCIMRFAGVRKAYLFWGQASKGLTVF